MLARVGPVDAVTVMLGSNDLLCGAGAEETAARMETLLRFMAERVGNAGLLLLAPPPMLFGLTTSVTATSIAFVESTDIDSHGATVTVFVSALETRRTPMVVQEAITDWPVSSVFVGERTMLNT